MPNDLPDWQNEIVISGGGIVQLYAVLGQGLFDTVIDPGGAFPKHYDLKIDRPPIYDPNGDWISATQWRAPSAGTFRHEATFFWDDGGPFSSLWWLDGSPGYTGNLFTVPGQGIQDGSSVFDVYIPTKKFTLTKRFAPGDLQGMRLWWQNGLPPAATYSWRWEVNQVG